MKAAEDAEDEADDDYSFAEDDDEYDDYSYETEEDGNLEESSDDNENGKMPRTPPRSASKMPPRKKKAPPAPIPAAAMNNLTAELDALGLAHSTYNFDVSYPYMLFPYTVDRRDGISVDFLIHTFPEGNFRPVRKVGDPKVLQLGVEVPQLFCSAARLQKAQRQNPEFTRDTSVNTAYKKLAEKVADDFDDGDPVRMTFLGNPQEVQLPFACEDDITFDLNHFRQPLANFEALFGEARQHFSVLTVNLTSVKKPKTRRQYSVQVLDGSDEEPADGAGGMDTDGGDDV